MAESEAANKVPGAAKETLGKVREEVGDAVGNKEMEAKGAAQKIEGQAQRKVGEAQDEIDDAEDEMAEKTKR